MVGSINNHVVLIYSSSPTVMFRKFNKSNGLSLLSIPFVYVVYQVYHVYQVYQVYHVYHVYCVSMMISDVVALREQVVGRSMIRHIAQLLFVALVSAHNCVPNYGGVPNPAPEPDGVAPESFTATFCTDVTIDGEPSKPIVLNVTRAWSPHGVDRFFSLMKDNYYQCAAFFRVVPDFVVQYGIAAEPSETSKWDTTIPDDPVLTSNVMWTVSFATAGPDTRTTQLFINYVDNAQLDTSGFSPFAIVTSGFDTALAITNPTPGDSDGVSQFKYTKLGNKWILDAYPNISLITFASLGDISTCN